MKFQSRAICPWQKMVMLQAGYMDYADRKVMAHLSDYQNTWNAGLNIPVIRYAERLLT